MPVTIFVVDDPDITDLIMPVNNGFTDAEQPKQTPQLGMIPALTPDSLSQVEGETSQACSWGLTCKTEDYIGQSVSLEELLAGVEKTVEEGGRLVAGDIPGFLGKPSFSFSIIIQHF